MSGNGRAVVHRSQGFSRTSADNLPGHPGNIVRAAAHGCYIAEVREVAWLSVFECDDDQDRHSEPFRFKNLALTPWPRGILVRQE